MGLGQLLGGAGVVGQGWRQAEEAERAAHQSQLILEEQNRVADLKRQLAGLQVASFQPVDVAQFTQPFLPGQAMPMGSVGVPVVPAPGAAAPAAPVTPAAPAAPVTPAAPAAPVAPAALPPVAMTPKEIWQQRNRLALLRAPAAVLDVFQAPAAVGRNLVSRVAGGINYLFGTDLPTPRAPMTPFYDRYVRQRELQLDTGIRPIRPKPAAPAVAPAQPTKQALQYDNKDTPYDALITQSAQRHGLDPTVFKRLIGTESSFRPAAVSPRGERFGLGIAQIAEVHGLTREQRLDPNTAIPFAAQLLARYLQESGGNYEQAIQRYKGAASERGKAAMAGPIRTILSGIVPSVQAASAAPLPLEVPSTQARNMEMAEFYLADPESIPFELQQINQIAQQQIEFLTRQRNEVAQLAQVYLRSGTVQGVDAAMRLRDSIVQIDENLHQIQHQVGQKQMYLHGMQGLRELATANDPRRLAGVLSQYMGTPVGIQPRPDGNYNFFVNGVRVQENVSPGELAQRALREFSPAARQAVAASAALENELALKRKYGVETVNAMRDIQKAIIAGEYKLAEERAKQAQGKLTIDSTTGRAFFVRGGRVFIIAPDREIRETPLGEVELSPIARQVVGLDMGR